MGAWAEKIYLDCGGAESDLLELQLFHYPENYGFLLFLDLDKTYFIKTNNPQYLSPWEVRVDNYNKLIEQDILVGQDDLPFELVYQRGTLEQGDPMIYLGKWSLVYGEFIKWFSINRVELIFKNIRNSNVRHMCELSNYWKYNFKIRKWQKKMDKDKREYEESTRKKF